MDMKAYYQQMVGMTITKFFPTSLKDVDGMEGFPKFELTDKESGFKWTIEVSCDPEGNHGGFLFFTEIPTVGTERGILRS